MSQFLSLEEAARGLGSSPATLMVRAQRGEVRAFLDSGCWRFRPEDVERARAEDLDVTSAPATAPSEDRDDPVAALLRDSMTNPSERPNLRVDPPMSPASVAHITPAQNTDLGPDDDDVVFVHLDDEVTVVPDRRRYVDGPPSSVFDVMLPIMGSEFELAAIDDASGEYDSTPLVDQAQAPGTSSPPAPPLNGKTTTPESQVLPSRGSRPVPAGPPPRQIAPVAEAFALDEEDEAEDPRRPSSNSARRSAWEQQLDLAEVGRPSRSFEQVRPIAQVEASFSGPQIALLAAGCTVLILLTFVGLELMMHDRVWATGGHGSFGILKLLGRLFGG